MIYSTANDSSAPVNPVHRLFQGAWRSVASTWCTWGLVFCLGGTALGQQFALTPTGFDNADSGPRRITGETPLVEGERGALVFTCTFGSDRTDGDEYLLDELAFAWRLTVQTGTTAHSMTDGAALDAWMALDSMITSLQVLEFDKTTGALKVAARVPIGETLGGFNQGLAPALHAGAELFEVAVGWADTLSLDPTTGTPTGVISQGSAILSVIHADIVVTTSSGSAELAYAAQWQEDVLISCSANASESRTLALTAIPPGIVELGASSVSIAPGEILSVPISVSAVGEVRIVVEDDSSGERAVSALMSVVEEPIWWVDGEPEGDPTQPAAESTTAGVMSASWGLRRCVPASNPIPDADGEYREKKGACVHWDTYSSCRGSYTVPLPPVQLATRGSCLWGLSECHYRYDLVQIRYTYRYSGNTPCPEGCPKQPPPETLGAPAVQWRRACCRYTKDVNIPPQEEEGVRDCYE